MVEDIVTLSSGAVARQLGISPATLRTWAHRYGLEPSARSEGAHRRYTPEDVERLVAMQRLMRAGVPVAEAAGQVLREVPSVELPHPVDEAVTGPRAVRALWEAACALDGQRCAHMVASSVRDLGVLPTWDGLVRPVLKRAGDQWENKQVGIDVEHVLSDAVTAGLADGHAGQA
ncbi:MAG: MerR family transcriptional regulator [Candidatus Nanopelagicales bacterium]